MSRSAVSQHLKILREAGLVRQSAASARAVYEIDAAGLQTLQQWLEGFSNETRPYLEASAEPESAPTRSGYR